MIIFTVPTVPVAQPRQRHRVVQANGRTFAANYTPRDAPVQTFKAALQRAAADAGAPLDGPVSVMLTFVLPRPKALCWKRRPMPAVWHDKKPDAENLVKSSLDALTGLLWRDDAQVCKLSVQKLVAAGGEQPHVYVQVEPLPVEGKDVLPLFAAAAQGE